MTLFTNTIENIGDIKISSEGTNIILEIFEPNTENCTGKITTTIDKLREAFKLFTNSELSDDVFIAINDELNKISTKETFMSKSKELLDLCESVSISSEDGVFTSKDESGNDIYIIKKEGTITALTAEDFEKTLEACGGNSGLMITDTGLPTDNTELSQDDKDVIQSELDEEPICDPELDPDCEEDDDEEDYEESFYESLNTVTESFTGEKFDEATPVTMYRGGMKILDCPPGFKLSGKSCKRMSSIELRNRVRSAKKNALKRKGRKRKLSAASRLRAARTRILNKNLDVGTKKSMW